jgi:hypothetical protein
MSNRARYFLFGILGFLLMGGYVFVTDGQKFGWNNVDVTLLLARGVGGGVAGLLLGLGIAWLARRSPAKDSK